MKTRFFYSVLASAITMLIINGGIFPLFYGDFLQNYSALPLEIWLQVQKPVAETNIPLSLIAMICIGTLITAVMVWSQAKTFLQGIKSGAILGLLMVGSVNLGLLATTNYYSITSGIVDIFVGGLSIALTGGVAAIIMGRKSKSITK